MYIKYDRVTKIYINIYIHEHLSWWKLLWSLASYSVCELKLTSTATSADLSFYHHWWCHGILLPRQGSPSKLCRNVKRIGDIVVVRAVRHKHTLQLEVKVSHGHPLRRLVSPAALHNIEHIVIAVVRPRQQLPSFDMFNNLSRKRN